MRLVLVAVMAGSVIGCSTHNTDTRPMNYGEKTLVSNKVAQMVDESESGAIDTREFDEVRCERIRITGSHMVQRHCYTVSEREAADRANQDEVRDRFGASKCMDRSFACSGASPQDPISRLPNRGPGG